MLDADIHLRYNIDTATQEYTMNKSQNLAFLLKWALKNGNEHNARVIAAHIIAGTELCNSELH